MATRMLQRRGTAAEWAAENPVLSSGEIGFETDTKIIKLGDGVTAWADLGLPYVPTGGGTMTGPLGLVAPTADAHGARKIDLDNKISGFRDVISFELDDVFIKGNYPWLRLVKIRCWGAGAGGGGASATGAGEASVGAGGGGGAYCESIILASALASSENVVVGAKGLGGLAGDNDGNPGGLSEVNGFCRASGGSPGGGSAASSAGLYTVGGAGGGASIGNIVRSFGGAGSAGIVSGGQRIGGDGGNSGFGGGGARAPFASAGFDAPSVGGGGSGALIASNTAAAAGGDGYAGLVLIELYA